MQNGCGFHLSCYFLLRYPGISCVTRCACDELPCPLLTWLANELRTVCPELQGLCQLQFVLLISNRPECVQTADWCIRCTFIYCCNNFIKISRLRKVRTFSPDWNYLWLILQRGTVKQNVSCSLVCAANKATA